MIIKRLLENTEDEDFKTRVEPLVEFNEEAVPVYESGRLTAWQIRPVKLVIQEKAA